MIKNYISENITYLIEKSDTIFTQDDFGNQFDLNRGAINSYVKNKAVPKLETIQRICLHYKISIDDFVSRELEHIEAEQKQNFVNEPPQGYGIIDLKYVELLENSLKDKEIIIETLKLKFGYDNEKSNAG